MDSDDGIGMRLHHNPLQNFHEKWSIKKLQRSVLIKCDSTMTVDLHQT